MIPPLGDVLSEFAAGARLLRSLPSFLRHPVTLQEARATLRLRLERRDDDFLALVRRAMYEHRGSPYRQLLALAGCEYGDLERLVREEGVEGALRVLYRHGVYLSPDEFRGRRPTVRGGVTLRTTPHLFRNPLSSSHLSTRTSGSRSEGTSVPYALAYVRDRAVSYSLLLEARGGAAWLNAPWGSPGWAMLHLHELAGSGAAASRWFSLVDLTTAGLHPRYRWGARVMRWGSLLARVPLPRPLYVPLHDPLPIARWMEEVIRDGRTPHVLTSASCAVRLCRAAVGAGIDLRGAKFTMSGEPITEARLAVVRRAGAEAVPRYATTESGTIGYGCLAPEEPDDLHFLSDSQALIQAGPDGEAREHPATALFVSSLRPTTPVIFLNVALGDSAAVAQRACGCPLEQLGWTTHLHTVRSYEKLTGMGMTFHDTDVIRVLEEVLPSRFGGTPGDYQLVEEEAAGGEPKLRLLVHPGIGPLDGDAVAECFLAAIGGGSGTRRVMELVWRQAGLIHVERRVPEATATGKILHLHVKRRSASGSESRLPGG